MKILDTPEQWAPLDPDDMYGRILGFPAQLSEAEEIGRHATLGSLTRRKFKNIVVVGLGGSAIGGDLVRTYLSDTLPLPMLVVRDYVLPVFVSRDSLVVVSSYSGNTEETLSAYSQAHAMNASIIAFTTGGALESRARADGHPVVQLPGGYMPRAALGYSFFPMLIVLERLNLAPDQTAAMAETRTLLEERTGLLAREVPQSDNPAKQAASAWYKHVPIIYGGTVRFDAVALRIKCQVAENAKQLAFANVFPEFNHNELVGYGKTEEIRKLLSVTILRDAGDHRRTGFRMAIVRKMIADLEIAVAEVESTGREPLARMFSLIQWGDYVSYYLAMLNGVDPTPIEVIEHLKRELAER